MSRATDRLKTAAAKLKAAEDARRRAQSPPRLAGKLRRKKAHQRAVRSLLARAARLHEKALAAERAVPGPGALKRRTRAPLKKGG